MKKDEYDKKVLAEFLPLTTTNSFYNSDPSQKNYVSYIVKMEENTTKLEENAIELSGEGKGLTKFLNCLRSMDK